ncbi:hypothetical protein ElyMa_004714200 [Elysia marginata]|uniref:Uncharacterized protein n=1 Tax=Elysia marginata TaxID=1093978 RepID=A0AAV4IBM0_9GAST|nr:hypothetical protein ElyMa_004714200 [Elysia marginata]
MSMLCLDISLATCAAFPVAYIVLTFQFPKFKIDLGLTIGVVSSWASTRLSPRHVIDPEEGSTVSPSYNASNSVPARVKFRSEFAGTEWLTDNDDMTCDKAINRYRIHLYMYSKLIFSWARLVFKSVVFAHELAISIDNVHCEKPAQVDTRTVDISCKGNQVLYEVVMRGSLKSLCSVYISGGRVVSIKQPTEASDTDPMWPAANAVDGKNAKPDNLTSQKSTCYHSNTDLTKADFWKLKFTKLPIFYRIVIQNRRDYTKQHCCEDRLIGFRLEAQQAHKDTHDEPPIYHYHDNGTKGRDEYELEPDRPLNRPIKSITIWARMTYMPLTLCEVTVYGGKIKATGQLNFYFFHLSYPSIGLV